MCTPPIYYYIVAWRRRSIRLLTDGVYARKGGGLPRGDVFETAMRRAAAKHRKSFVVTGFRISGRFSYARAPVIIFHRSFEYCNIIYNNTTTRILCYIWYGEMGGVDGEKVYKI